MREGAHKVIESILACDQGKIAFANELLSGFLSRPFPSYSKSEFEVLIFQALVATGEMDPSVSHFEIASLLHISPSKARSLQLQFFLRSTYNAEEISEMLAAAFLVSKPVADSNYVRFGIQNPFLTLSLRARLSRDGIFAEVVDDVLRVPKAQFGTVMTKLLDEDRLLLFERELKKRGVTFGVDGFLQRLLNDALAEGKSKLISEAGHQFARVLRDIFSGENEIFEQLDSILGAF